MKKVTKAEVLLNALCCFAWAILAINRFYEGSVIMGVVLSAAFVGVTINFGRIYDKYRKDNPER